MNLTNRYKSGKIGNCHVNKEVFEMFYDKQQAVSACLEEPSLIFNLIKLGYFDVIETLMDKNKVDANICDGADNNIVMRLLKARQYELVLRMMKKRNWDVNHQNYDGDTFGHILACDNSVAAVRVMEQLMKNKKYLPNIKNNKGETVLDKAVNNNYTFTAFKILEDKRFTNIDISSFKKLCNACVNNVCYGKYSKLNNLEVIVESLEKKDLVPSMREVISKIIECLDEIKNELVKKNRFSTLDKIINSTIEATV